MFENKTKIKICGLKTEKDITIVNKYKPDFIGFVFADFSKRYIEPSKAAELKALLSPDIQAVGVFVDQDPETVIRLLREGTIDIAQLHGKEDEDYIRLVKETTGKPVIKMFNMKQAAADEMSHADSDEKINDRILTAAVNASPADYVLLDSGYGTGTTFDWSVLDEIKRPYFLAGGLSLNNIEAAVKNLHPYAVDVSSGVETDGTKDEEKVDRFIDIVSKC